MYHSLFFPPPPHTHKQFAIVQLVGVQQLSQCPIEALIFVWNDRQKQFTGLVPLEQEKFINVLKQVLNAQRQRNLMLQQQQQAQQAQQGQQMGMVSTTCIFCSLLSVKRKGHLCVPVYMYV